MRYDLIADLGSVRTQRLGELTALTSCNADSGLGGTRRLESRLT
jgi:hypothetical protein